MNVHTLSPAYARPLLTLVLATLIGSTAQAQAQRDTADLYGEVGYASVSLKGAGRSIDLGLLRGTLGWNAHPNLGLELMLGTGIKDDKVGGVTIKFSHTYAAYLKPRFEFGNGLEVFARVGYADTKLTASYRGESSSLGGGDISYGVGAGYRFTPGLYGSVDYMNYVDKEGIKAHGPMLSIGVSL